MGGECTKTRLLNCVIPIPSPTTIQQFSDSNISWALKMRRTVKKRPEQAVKDFYSKESSRAWSLESNYIGNPIHLLFRKKLFHLFLSTKPNSSKATARVSR